MRIKCSLHTGDFTVGPKWTEPKTKFRNPPHSIWETEYETKVPLGENVGFLPHTLVKNKSLQD